MEDNSFAKHQQAALAAGWDERTFMRRTRQFYLSDPVHLAVHRWLVPLGFPPPYRRSPEEADADFVRILGPVGEAVQSNPLLREAFMALSEHVGRPIRDGYLGLHGYYRRPQISPMQTYLSVVYARARASLRNSWVGSEDILADAGRWVDGAASQAKEIIQARLTELGPSFVGHLVMEAEYRAAEDPDFAERMDSAWAALHALPAPKGDRRTIEDLLSPGVDLRALNQHWISLAAHAALSTTLWD